MHIPEWVPSAIFYQIFPDRFRNGNPRNDPPGAEPWGGVPTRENSFGGDLQGVIDGLPYIRELGCNAIYLNPIFHAGTNHKYDTHDYLKIDPAFGDDEVFDELISQAHAQGIRVVLDGVFNHCGLGFAPFADVVEKGPASRYRDWFDVYDFPLRVNPSTPNYATCGGAHYLPRLNASNPEVEEFVREVALYWLGRGIDGWRLDVPYEIATDFWRRFRAGVKSSYPDAYLVAEEWRDPREFLTGDTFDGATNYGLRGLLLDFVAKRALTGEAFVRALTTLQQALPAGSEVGMLNLLGSHDTPRALTEFGGDIELLQIALTTLFTLPGAPLVYYGDEVGMEGGNDPDCRRTFPWDEEAWNGTLRTRVKQLAILRSGASNLRHGQTTPVFGNDRVAAYAREFAGQRALVILNTTELSRSISVPAPYPDGTELKDLLAGSQQVVRRGSIDFDPLPAKTALILVPR